MMKRWRSLLATVATLPLMAPVAAQDSFGERVQEPPPAPPQSYPPSAGQPPQGYPQGSYNSGQTQAGQPPPSGYPRQGGYSQGTPQGGYPPGDPQQGAYSPGAAQTAPPQGQAPGAHQQGGYPQAGYGATQPLDQLMQMERQDFGVPPTSQLHAGAMHGPTPTSIPGGQVITTKGLVSLVEGGQTPYRLFDVLGASEILPGAIGAVPASQAGTFNDATQREFGNFLQSVTGGNREIPLVFYCLSTQCWMSYNAALRAINLGYTNVLWYRGGIEAWKAAGRAVQPAQMSYRR